MSLLGFKVYNIYRKVDGGYVASFSRQEYCHQFMKIMKEQHFFDNGSMDTAEEGWGENSYYIEYGFALKQTSIATYNVNFSDWP